jgi:hypothetical protein
MGAGDARAVVNGMPSTMSAVLTGARGDEQHPDLGWNVTAYVLHVADNLRVWAERLAGIALGGPATIAPYDENELAAARNYGGISLRAALWSLRRGAGDWDDAFAMTAPDMVMDHPERGPLDYADIARANAHDAAHHLWDVRRSLAAAH